METMTEPRTITQAEYLQLVGLLTLARMWKDKLDDVERALYQITKEGDGDPKEIGGHTSDAIWMDYSAEDLLERLGIKVSPA